MEVSSRKAANPLARVTDSETPEGVGHRPYSRRDTDQKARHFHFTAPNSRGDDFYRGDGHTVVTLGQRSSAGHPARWNWGPFPMIGS
jgi:hypothetical protein